MPDSARDFQAPSPAPNGDLRQQESGARDSILSQFKKLMTANLIVRLANFTFWKVSTSKEKKDAKEFISGEIKTKGVFRPGLRGFWAKKNLHVCTRRPPTHRD